MAVRLGAGAGAAVRLGAGAGGCADFCWDRDAGGGGFFTEAGGVPVADFGAPEAGAGSGLLLGGGSISASSGTPRLAIWGCTGRPVEARGVSRTALKAGSAVPAGSLAETSSSIDLILTNGDSRSARDTTTGCPTPIDALWISSGVASVIWTRRSDGSWASAPCGPIALGLPLQSA